MTSKDVVDISSPENTNKDDIKKNKKDLIDDSEDIEKNQDHDNSLNMNDKPNISNEENSKKYIPKNEHEALRTKIIKLELNEKNENIHNYDFHMHDNIDNMETQPTEKFKVPPELKKTFIVTIILAVLGVALIICGCIKAISDSTPGGGMMFWVLGGVVIIPGGFYSYQFYKARRAKEDYQRQDILDNIPQL